MYIIICNIFESFNWNAPILTIKDSLLEQKSFREVQYPSYIYATTKAEKTKAQCTINSSSQSKTLLQETEAALGRAAAAS